MELSKLNWRVIAEAIAVVSVVASLLFVGYELRLARDIATAEGFTFANQTSQAVRDIITENSEVWHKGCLSQELSPEEEVQFSFMVSSVNNQKFTTWNRARTGITGADPRIFSTEHALTIYRYPGFERAWLALYDAGDTSITQRVSPFRDEVQSIVDELKASGPAQTISAAQCGR